MAKQGCLAGRPSASLTVRPPIVTRVICMRPGRVPSRERFHGNGLFLPPPLLPREKGPALSPVGSFPAERRGSVLELRDAFIPAPVALINERCPRTPPPL